MPGHLRLQPHIFMNSPGSKKKRKRKTTLHPISYPALKNPQKNIIGYC